MKKIKAKLCFFMVLLLFSSCSNTDFKSLYTSSDYNAVIEKADYLLSEELDKEALYYRMMSYYKLMDYEGTTMDAELYIALYNKEKNNELHDALRLSLYFSDLEKAIKAGRLIHDKFEMDKTEAFAYFSSLMEAEDYENANKVYNEIRPTITPKEAAILLLRSKASSVLLISNLERWYEEEGYSDEYLNILASAATLLIPRGEGDLILPLLLEAETKTTNPRVYLTIGDIYASLDNIQKARIYYLKCEDTNPSLVKLKLASLR